MDVSTIKGFYTLDCLDIRKLQFLYEKASKFLKKEGFIKKKFPRIGLYSNFLKEKEHFKLNSEVYKLEKQGYFLTPTAESIAYPIIYEDKSTSYPIKWYDVGPVWRNQSKITKKYFRAKQITSFFEAHAIFSNKDNCKKEFFYMLNLLERFFKQIGLPEVELVKRPEDDKFNGAEETYAFDYDIEGKKIQIASAHYLGSNFNDAYNKNNLTTYGYCWGFTERILGVLREKFKEDYKYIFEKQLLLIYKKLNPKQDKKEDLLDLKFEPLLLGIITLEHFNSRNFKKAEDRWAPVATIKIDSLKEKITENSTVRFIPTREDILLKNLETHYQNYISKINL